MYVEKLFFYITNTIDVDLYFEKDLEKIVFYIKEENKTIEIDRNGITVQNKKYSFETFFQELFEYVALSEELKNIEYLMKRWKILKKLIDSDPELKEKYEKYKKLTQLADIDVVDEAEDRIEIMKKILGRENEKESVD